jgi:hypothetical protein
VVRWSLLLHRAELRREPARLGVHPGHRALERGELPADRDLTLLEAAFERVDAGLGAADAAVDGLAGAGDRAAAALRGPQEAVEDPGEAVLDGDGAEVACRPAVLAAPSRRRRCRSGRSASARCR